MFKTLSQAEAVKAALYAVEHGTFKVNQWIKDTGNSESGPMVNYGYNAQWRAGKIILHVEMNKKHEVPTLEIWHKSYCYASYGLMDVEVLDKIWDMINWYEFQREAIKDEQKNPGCGYDNAACMYCNYSETCGCAFGNIHEM